MCLLCCVLVVAIVVVIAVVLAAAVVVVLLGATGGLLVRRATRKAKKVYDLSAFQGYDGEVVDDGMRREFRELALEDLKFEKKIGEGAFGKVYLGYWRDTTIVAVKQLNVQCDEKAKKEFIHEANVMARVGNHPNVVHFIGAITTSEESFYMISEFAQNGSLLDLLTQGRIKVDDNMKLDFARDAARGVAHLHAEKVVHRDIAARNFLVSNDLRVMVADFGLSRVVEKIEGKDAVASRTQSSIGPIRWMAPESLRNREYSESSDVYMFGVFLYELASGETPFEGMSIQDVMQGVVHSGLRPSIPDSSHPLLARIMPMCWNEDPRKRPTFKTILDILADEDGASSLAFDENSSNKYVDGGYYVASNVESE